MEHNPVDLKKIDQSQVQKLILTLETIQGQNPFAKAALIIMRRSPGLDRQRATIATIWFNAYYLLVCIDMALNSTKSVDQIGKELKQKALGAGS